MGLKIVDACPDVSAFTLASGMVFRVNKITHNKVGYLMIADDTESAMDLETGYLHTDLSEFSEDLNRDNLILNAKLVIDI